MLIRSPSLRVFPMLGRIHNLQNTIRSFLSCPSPPAKDWLQLLGHLSSVIHLVPGSRRRMRLVQIQLNQQWDRQSTADDHPILWDPSSRRDLEWWLEDKNLAQSITRATPMPSAAEGPLDSAPHPQVPLRSPRASADRVETVKRYLRYRGFCSKVAQFLVCNLVTSAIKGYKAMLNSVLVIRGLDLSKDQVLRLIIRACSSQPLRRTKDLRPSWNLDAPFEPLWLLSTRDLTRKTLFLLALATAQRVGEIQALFHKTSWQGQDLLVSYLPEFIAKTDTDAHSTPREFRIKSLATVVGSEDVERLLCPVQALPTTPRNLFLAIKCPSRPMSKAAISFFLWDTIKSAHASSCCELKVRAHNIHGIATSMLMWKNCSVTTILRAACWRTQSIFADHYLWEIVRQDWDIFALDPVVTAGHVVD
ncbi:hypothetical protein E2C01_018012 [Portunus trituberculatus]|uniref:Tyr recombinase domain-containing protein n=1 Tax=Portunus trituberculatus TaxID=210409 RepID=A0A5B7DU02_PORTR|nr:hypothetical protein [Portunus trituberculatus]